MVYDCTLNQSEQIKCNGSPTFIYIPLGYVVQGSFHKGSHVPTN